MIRNNTIDTNAILEYNISTKELTVTKGMNTACVGCRFNPDESHYSYCAAYNYHRRVGMSCMRYWMR